MSLSVSVSALNSHGSGHNMLVEGRPGAFVASAVKWGWMPPTPAMLSTGIGSDMMRFSKSGIFAFLTSSSSLK